MLIVKPDCDVKPCKLVRHELRKAFHGKYTFGRIEQCCHTYREEHMEYAVQVRCCITNHRENECRDQKSETLMKPLENTVCHFVEHKRYGHQCGTGNCVVVVSLEAAPVQEDKSCEQYNAVELTCVVAHDASVIEPLHESVFLLVEAEEDCQKKEGKEKFYGIKSLYHKMYKGF